jgi:hypothetical protein
MTHSCWHRTLRLCCVGVGMVLMLGLFSGGEAGKLIGAEAVSSPQQGIRGLPHVKICQDADSSITVLPNEEYGDALVCDCTEGVGPWQDYAVPGPEGDNRIVHFVVDGMAGKIRLTNADGDRLIFYHPGGCGCSLGDDDGDWQKALNERGIQVATVVWEPGVDLVVSGKHRNLKGDGIGWFTRSRNEPYTLSELSARPAAVIKWVYDNVANGRPFGTVGTSAGANATFAAFHYYGLGEILDYQMLIGGPIAWDLNILCGGKSYSPGVCENAPAKDCTIDQQCGGERNACANRYEIQDWLGDVKYIIDYFHMNGHACVNGQYNASFGASSLKFSQTDWSNSFLIEFVIDENQRAAALFGDTGVGLTANAAQVYRALKGPKSWTDHDGYTHSASVRTSHLIELTADQVAGNMPRGRVH